MVLDAFVITFKLLTVTISFSAKVADSLNSSHAGSEPGIPGAEAQEVPAQPEGSMNAL